MTSRTDSSSSTMRIRGARDGMASTAGDFTSIHRCLSLKRTGDRRATSLVAKGPEIHAGRSLQNRFCDQPRGDRRQEDTVAQMAGGQENARNWPGPQYRPMVVGVGAKPRPIGSDRQLGNLGAKPNGRLEDLGGRRRRVSLLEPGQLVGASQEQSAIAALHQIARFADDALAQWSGERIELDDLAAHRLDGVRFQSRTVEE